MDGRIPILTRVLAADVLVGISAYVLTGPSILTGVCLGFFIGGWAGLLLSFED